MKSKTSFFNLPIIIEDLKRLWGLAVLYFLALFFTGPLQIMLRINDPDTDVQYMVEHFLYMELSEMQAVFAMAFCILLSMLIFRYLHTERSTTVMHGFPITRKEFYHSHSIAGILLILIPVLVNGLVLIGIMGMNNDGSELFQEVFTMQNINIWMVKTVLINITIFCISTLTAIFSGITIVQGVLSFIFVLLPYPLGSLIIGSLNQLLYGFSTNYSSFERMMEKLTPLGIVLANEKVGIGLVAWYIFFSVVLYVAAYYFYKNRQLEKASDPIAINVLKPIFKYGVTFCAMILGGEYFHTLVDGHMWLYIGYILGAYVGYLIAQMVIQKSIWVFKNIKGFAVYSVIILIVFGGLKLDITGFEKRVPNVDKIDNAYYGYGVYGYANGREEGLQDRDNIKAITELHKQLIENKKQFINNENNEENRIVGIGYTLNNGKRLYREYRVPDEFVESDPYIQDVFESPEYKISQNPIMNLNTSTIGYILIDPHAPIRRNVKVIDSAEINEMVEAIKKDIMDETYEEYKRNPGEWANIVLRLEIDPQVEDKNDRLYLSWKKSYKNLSSWMKEKGYYEKARIMPEDIDYVSVGKIEASESGHAVAIDPASLDSMDSKIEIRDKEKIEYLLNNYKEYGPKDTEYIVGFYLRNGDRFFGWVDETKLPSE